MKKHHLLLWLFIILIVINCAGNKKTTIIVPVSEKDLPFVPAGVDSALALEARKKASKLFSTYEASSEADSIYKDVIDYVKIVDELYSKLNDKKDTLKILRSKVFNLQKELKNKKSKLLEDRKKLQIITQKVEKDSATIDIVISLLEYYLFDARSKLEHAYSIDPFNLNILQLSGLSENNRGRMYADTTAFHNAMKYFFRYLEHDRGNYSIYSAISFSYYQLKNWQKAYEYARKAKEIYAITSYFDRPLKKIPVEYADTTLPPYADPRIYFELLYTKGLTEIWSHQPDSALASLKEALLFAQSESDKNNVFSFIKNYIYWDGKNIRTAERHLEILDSMRVNNYKWAHGALLELLPKLSTNKARYAVTWEVARIENDYFENTEKAVERLYPVIVELDSIKETPNFFESPADTNKQKYFVDCGQMLLNLGRKYRNEGDVKKANKYLAQDTTIDWKGRAKAFLLIRPEIPDNIIGRERQRLYYKKRLKLLFRAYALKKNLEPEEVDMMYNEIINIYRSLRDNQKMKRYYFESLKEKQRRKSN